MVLVLWCWYSALGVCTTNCAACFGKKIKNMCFLLPFLLLFLFFTLASEALCGKHLNLKEKDKKPVPSMRYLGEEGIIAVEG